MVIGGCWKTELARLPWFKMVNDRDEDEVGGDWSTADAEMDDDPWNGGLLIDWASWMAGLLEGGEDGEIGVDDKLDDCW